MPHRCSLRCIVPPHMLEGLARNGDDAQRDAALRTLAHDATIRLRRVHRARPAGAPADDAPQPATHQPGKPQRTIFDVQHQQQNPSTTPARSEGGPPTSDPAVNEAYDGLGSTYDLYWTVYQRDSIDGQGLPLEAWVHYATNYDNAFWDGQRMLFGDGDGTLFTRFTRSLDVIGHELTHGVTQHEANLDYVDQPGALNESISDAFGSLVRQRALGQTADQADWLIGPDIIGPDFHGVAIRSMKAPGTAYDDPVLGKDEQPASFNDYVDTADDNGGVHLNSGIPNHGFYLLATRLGGHAWERAGQIWYDALRDPKLPSNATFERFAGVTARVAAARYGAGGEEAAAVAAAWAGVDVPPLANA